MQAGGLLEIFFTKYGPVGFGVVCFLMIWKVAIVPELKALREDRAALRVDQQANAAIADTLHDTATILRECVRDLRQVKDELLEQRKGSP